MNAIIRSSRLQVLVMICLFFILAVTCYPMNIIAQDTFGDLMNRLQAMQIYKGKIDDQLNTVRNNKRNLLALRDAQSVIDSLAEKFNLSRSDFEVLKTTSDKELIQLAQQEQTLILRSSILASSIQILSQRANFQVDILDPNMNSGKYIPQCICVDMKTGEPCKKSEAATAGYKIEEVTLENGMVIKNLSSSYNYIPATCSEYLTDFYNGKTGNGFYLVRPVASLPEFPVYCDMNNGGWAYVNGLLTLDAPSKLPINPITPDLTGSIEFKSLFALATQAKSNVGDECVLVAPSEVDDYHERVMQYMCTLNGFSLSTTPSKYISFFQYWIK